MPNSQIKSLTVDGVTYDIVDRTSGYITANDISKEVYYIELFGTVNWTDVREAVAEEKTIIALVINDGDAMSVGIVSQINIDTENPSGPSRNNNLQVGTFYQEGAGAEAIIAEWNQIDAWTTISYPLVTSSDITNWNSKTSNTGTITSVQTTAGAHTTINTSSGAASFNVPTKTSHLTNDSGFITTDSDEKVKQIPLNNNQDAKAILLGNTLGTSETTATAYTSGQLIWSDYFKQLSVYGSSASYCGIKAGSIWFSTGTHEAKISSPQNINTNYTYTLPKATGTIALTSDIPTVPTNVSSFTNDAGYLTSSDIASVMKYKGTKANYAALPSSGNTTGDVWHLTDTGAEWAWDGSAWQELGTAIDLSGYVLASKTVNGVLTEFNNNEHGIIRSTHQATDNYAFIGTYASSESDSTYIDLVASDGVNYNEMCVGPTETYISNIITPVSDGDAANKKYVDDSISALSIPTKVSDLTNDSGFITSYTETDPVFSASAAAGITSSDISNWNSIVSDDKTWNGVTLNKGASYNNNGDIYIPYLDTYNGTVAYTGKATSTPTQGRIAKYDVNAYLYSTTPFANDNSTKVATTAYVDGAVSGITVPTKVSDLTNDSGFITSYTDEKVKSEVITGSTLYIVGTTNSSTSTGTLGKHNSFSVFMSSNTDTDGITRLYLGNGTAAGTAGAKTGAIQIFSNSTYYVELRAGKSTRPGMTANRTIRLPDADGTIALTSDIPQVYSSNNTGGYLTMSTLPIYDGTVV